MKELGITQERLAERLGVTQGAVAHWLSGRREPPLDTIAKVLDALGLPPLGVLPEATYARKYPEHSKVAEARALFERATPRSRALIKRISQLDQQGALSEKDIKILEQIIERFTTAQ